MWKILFCDSLVSLTSSEIGITFRNKMELIINLICPLQNLIESASSIKSNYILRRMNFVFMTDRIKPRITFAFIKLLILLITFFNL